jgi:Rrf2 family protein
MALLKKNTDYAVRALIELAVCGGGYISSRSIADRQGLPYQFLRSITQELIKHGLVESKEGVKGGLKLIKDPKQIKIIDVIRIFQGDIGLSDCLFRKKLCRNRSTCVLRKEIGRIESLVEKEFGKLTIQGLIDKVDPESKRG